MAHSLFEKLINMTVLASSKQVTVFVVASLSIAKYRPLQISVTFI